MNRTPRTAYFPPPSPPAPLPQAGEGRKRRRLAFAALAALLALAVLAGEAHARTTLRQVCRVKGQEENTLQGLGLVVGLKGTGDGGNFLPAIRSLAVAMEMMGNPVGKQGTVELKDVKNVALVAVTATVPAGGARQGDKIDCVVSSVGSAKSLVGGRLLLAPLLGPNPKDQRVFALAEGPIVLEDLETPTTGRIHVGCRLEDDIRNPFTKDGKITLVLEPHYADFQVAQDVAEVVNSQMSFQSSGQPLARAVNQVNVEVTIPKQYVEDPVAFVAQVLALPVLEPETGPRVVINQRSGSIVIGGDVELGPVVVTHKNLVIEAGPGAPAGGQFVAVDSQQTDNPTLKSLVEALNAVHVPAADIIDIIKGLERNGKLHARLIIQ